MSLEAGLANRAVESMVLLPRPQAICRLEGVFQAEAKRLILLVGEEREALVRCGEMAQSVLRELGWEWELVAARGREEEIGLIVQIDPNQVGRSEGYRLTIQPGRITLIGNDPAGAFYGVQTLRQIVRNCRGSALPCLRIEDWPDFPSRGVMLDVSRDRVPTMEALYELVDLLAEWKVNQLQLYTEHTFAYRRHRTVWDQASPLTGEEILELDRYCRDRHIELVPNQNSFGHMARWLKHSAYNDLAENPESPGTLNPLDLRSLELVREMFDELLPHFASRQVNVGCDETGLGKNKSKLACEQRGTGRVYLDFLLGIYRLARERGKTMQFWGDIIMKYPELIPELPEGIVALEWGYEADHKFAEHGKKFAEAGVPFYVCPGTSVWNTLSGRTRNAIGNLSNAAENGRANGAIGFLNTNWGDNGHWEPMSIAYLGFAYGAAVSWALTANRELDLPRALDLHAFADEAGVMGRLAYDLGNAYLETGLEMRNTTVFTALLRRPEGVAVGRAGIFETLTAENLLKTIGYLDEVEARLTKTRMRRRDAELIKAEFGNVIGLVRHSCRQGIARAEAKVESVGQLQASDRKKLAGELEPLIADYRRLWVKRSRAGGLNDSAERFEKVLKMYR